MSTQHDRASNLQNRLGEHSQLRLENERDTLDEEGDHAGMPACLSHATGTQKSVSGGCAGSYRKSVFFDSPVKCKASVGMDEVWITSRALSGREDPTTTKTIRAG